MDKQKKQSIKFSTKPTSLAVDGNSIFINPYKQADLVFFQVENITEEAVTARGVSSLRMSLSQLESLKTLIEQVLADQKEKK